MTGRSHIIYISPQQVAPLVDPEQLRLQYVRVLISLLDNENADRDDLMDRIERMLDLRPTLPDDGEKQR